MRRTISITLSPVSVFLLLCMNGLAQVSVREETMTIPTWEIGPPSVHSLVTGSKGRIYPYTLNETLTDRKIDKNYRAVILENEYVQILILPEIGGRIHGALDKTNNYVWLYWQKTIKPGLIGMTGAWISGGIEWNFPHGHRPSGFMPVDHKILKHEDGSATVWVGETEPVYRMRWLVGITLYPGRSYMRCDYIFINPTNHRHPFQFWATAATHANEWSQAQYPGDMVTGHGKHEFWNWPVHNGVDLTWWKNSPNASSYFAFNNPSDWFGTYDHKERAGMVHVANHNVMPGKKLWTWGSGPSGRIWEDILSEGGGAYFEPQAGAWSDNQPDYHWMWPHEVRTVTDYWYPVRDLRGYHNATRDFAVNTEVKDGVGFAGVYATAVCQDHRVQVTDTRTGKSLLDRKVTISPDKPFAVEFPVEPGATVYDLRLSVSDPSGETQIDLQRKKPATVTLPEGQKDPGDPKKMNQDELYHSGEWLDKYVRTPESTQYFEEALRRDPSDSRVNTELGYQALKAGQWQEALKYLNRALERDADNSRIHFGIAMAHLGLKDLDKAEAGFYRASYTYDYFAQAYLNLVRLDLMKGDFTGAVDKIWEAESQNGKFADIQALKAVALRRQGNNEGALSAANRALELDPMHFMGAHERAIAAGAKSEQEKAETEWRSIMRAAAQNYLELACAYAEAGLFQEADQVLEGYVAAVATQETPGPTAGGISAVTRKPSSSLYPMFNYLRGYFRVLAGDSQGATVFFEQAANGPVAYVNPHRLEEKAALDLALERNPKDARARLFLGNLLYFGLRRESEGLEQWRTAVQVDPELSLAWRNIGYAESQAKNYPASYEAYQRVIALDATDSRALFEMDQVAERLEVGIRDRLALLEKLSATVEARDDLTTRLVDLRLQQGSPSQLQSAYETLRTRHFHTWEGSYGIHHAWVEVNERLGDLAAADKNFDLAIQHYRQAGEYPKNLEVAPRTPDFRAHINWNLARLNQSRGDTQAASAHLEEILSESYGEPHLGTYYQALAHKSLKNEKAYRDLMSELEKKARLYTSGGFEFRGRKEIIGHYLLSLILEERGDQAGAEAERRKAIEAEPQARRLAITEAQLEMAAAHQ